MGLQQRPMDFQKAALLAEFAVSLFSRYFPTMVTLQVRKNVQSARRVTPTILVALYSDTISLIYDDLDLLTS